MSLPMPLAAPVTMATLSFMRMAICLRRYRLGRMRWANPIHAARRRIQPRADEWECAWQNAAICRYASAGRRCTRCDVGLGRLLRRRRQRDAYDRALAELAVDQQLPAMQGGQHLGERQAEAGAAAGLREDVLDLAERLKDARQIVGGDADAGVADTEHYIGPAGVGREQRHTAA